MAYAFVYGTLRNGHHANFFLTENNAEFHGNGCTSEKFHFRCAGNPYVCVTDREFPDGEKVHVQGEVYKVDPKCMRELDRYEGYPMFYQRDLYPVQMDDGTEVMAWMYTESTQRDGFPVPDGDYNKLKGR